ncbi:MAG TPA: hypothetical protein ENH11_06535 [Candidatus Acetothermia bacterium]|nr:hypothetical protein [Candidatus Acetothermia bacterium]
MSAAESKWNIAKNAGRSLTIRLNLPGAPPEVINLSEDEAEQFAKDMSLALERRPGETVFTGGQITVQPWTEPVAT